MSNDDAAPPRPAATVALLRDGHQGLETWMMQRASAMTFASGAVVFPGGRVELADADVAVPWYNGTPEGFASRLDVDASTARAIVTAAIREVFEEAGVLLTAPVQHVDLERARAAVEQRTMSFAAWLAEESCALDVSTIRPWSRWITPASEPRRFDTWFFVAAMPLGAAARSASTEAVSAGWFTVADVLARADQRELRVLPPTVAMLRGLHAAGSVDAVLKAAAERSLRPVHPVIRRLADGTTVVEGGGEYILVRRQ